MASALAESNFELCAQLRDEIKALEAERDGGGSAPSPPVPSRAGPPAPRGPPAPAAKTAPPPVAAKSTSAVPMGGGGN